jgi:membrane-bound lytic murein transglycosylase D
MVGAMYAVNYAKEYGLEPTPVQMPAHIDTFMIKKNLHFRQISEVIGVPIDDLRDLNPQYYKDIVPGNQGDQILRLPFNYSNAFLDSQDTIYKYKAAEMFSGSVDDGRNARPAAAPRQATTSSGGGQWVYYKVRRGDTLGKIAARHHTTVKNLKSWNGLRSDKIRDGQRLKVGKR